MRAAATVRGADPVMSPVSPAHLAHEVRSFPGTLSYSGQRSGEEGARSCPGSAAARRHTKASGMSARPQLVLSVRSQKKPSGQLEYDALRMQILKIYCRVMFHKMWNYVFRATETPPLQKKILEERTCLSRVQPVPSCVPAPASNNMVKFADDDRENCYRQEVQHLAV